MACQIMYLVSESTGHAGFTSGGLTRRKSPFSSSYACHLVHCNCITKSFCFSWLAADNCPQCLEAAPSSLPPWHPTQLEGRGRGEKDFLVSLLANRIRHNVITKIPSHHFCQTGQNQVIGPVHTQEDPLHQEVGTWGHLRLHPPQISSKYVFLFKVVFVYSRSFEFLYKFQNQQ